MAPHLDTDQQKSKPLGKVMKVEVISPETCRIVDCLLHNVCGRTPQHVESNSFLLHYSSKGYTQERERGERIWVSISWINSLLNFLHTHFTPNKGQVKEQ